MIIYRSDLQDDKGRMCSKGARLWFKRYGLDWVDFCKNGIEAQTLLDTGDTEAIKVVNRKYGKE